MRTPLTDWQTRGAPVFATLFILAWAACALVFDTAQLGDNIEQYIWSQSMEWGYHKHPPMPTWILGGLNWLAGPSYLWMPLLSTLCFAATLWFTWAVGRQIAGEQAAALAVVLWSLLQYFSSGIQLYNHNTVMALWVALALWFALRATAHHSGWWLGVGLAAGSAMLSKYQALVPLTGIVIGLAASGRLATRQPRLGLAVSITMAIALFAPHLVWLVEHDFVTLRYASASVSADGVLPRFNSVLSFIANQLRVAVPLLAVLLLYAAWDKWAPRGLRAAVATQPMAAHWRIWSRALFSGPLGFLVLLALLAGVTLRNHWGVQLLQFSTLWLAGVWLTQAKQLYWQRLLLLIGIAQAISLGLYAYKQQDINAMSHERRLDTVYPSQQLATVAVSAWTTATRCPLRYVVGDFEAGLAALYSGRYPGVYINPTATPWISEADLRQSGAVYIVTDRSQVPTDIVPQHIGLTPDGVPKEGWRSVWAGVRLPANPCQ